MLKFSGNCLVNRLVPLMASLSVIRSDSIAELLALRNFRFFAGPTEDYAERFIYRAILGPLQWIPAPRGYGDALAECLC